MTEWMNGPLRGLVNNNNNRNLQQDANSVYLELVPFDIALTLTGGSNNFLSAALQEIVTEWFDECFEEAVATQGYRYGFDQMLLRPLSVVSTTTTYEGVSVWMTDKELPSETVVYSMQLDCLENSQASLLPKLQASSDTTGLGSFVSSVSANMNHNSGGGTSGGSGAGGEPLGGIVIVAILIAIMATGLLVFALVMAWRQQRTGKEYVGPATTTEAELGGAAAPTSATTTAGPYPDSSDDVTSSLSAYYKTGMAGGYKASRHQAGALNDAASANSMESYGYSLDGYASSIGIS